MARYAWYVRATDTLHRLTVMSLIGGTLYLSGGLAYTLYMNGKRFDNTIANIEKEENLKDKK